MGDLLLDFASEDNPDLIVGFETSDDAGVYRISDTLALVQTVDLITPVCDDPVMFGQIAAANSLSDVYAMGGRPLTVLNICCFPADNVPDGVFRSILKGAHDKVAEAGATLIGGHTVKDEELKVLSPDLYERFRKVWLKIPTVNEMTTFFEQKLPDWGVIADRDEIRATVRRSKRSFRTCKDVFAAAADNPDRTLDDATMDEFLPRL